MRYEVVGSHYEVVCRSTEIGGTFQRKLTTCPYGCVVELLYLQFVIYGYGIEHGFKVMVAVGTP